MTIECYYSDCKYHSNQRSPGDGPFCYELECRAAPEDIIKFLDKRREQVQQQDRTKNSKMRVQLANGTIKEYEKLCDIPDHTPFKILNWGI